MTSRKALLIPVIVLAMDLCFGIASASAQDTDAGSTNTDARREMTLTASTFGGYDTDLTQGGFAAPGTGIRTDAPLVGGSVAVHYAAHSNRLALVSDIVGGSVHYQAVDPITGTSIRGGMGVEATLTRKMHASGYVRSGYSPQFAFSVLPQIPGPVGEAPPPSSDYTLSGFEAIDYGTGADLKYDLSSRSSLHVNYGTGTYTFIGENYKLTSQSFGAGYSKGLTRYATLRFEYAEQRADYPLQANRAIQPLRNRTLDAGIDYSRPLSLTRRTILSFGTGSTSADNGEETFYNVAAHASLDHRIARTWDIKVNYSRGLGLVEGFSEPFFADSLALKVIGNASRRVQLIASAGYANGDLGLGSRANAYESLQGTGRIEIPLSRRLVLFADYVYYNYLFDRSIALPKGVSRGLDRQGVRAGLKLRIPVLQERTPRAAR
jgi:hypothetical protein